MRNVPSLETVYRDYSKKGVNFYYIYKTLAHPERDGLVQPFTIEERLAHVKRAKAQLQTEMPWVADSISNELKHAFGNRNNSEFVIDPKGKIVHARSWSDPEVLRADLAKLVGKVEKPTTVADLKRKSSEKKKPHAAASGVVPRVPSVEDGQVLKLTAKKVPDSDAIFYAKPRIEAERKVLSGGSGKLHIGFHLDPIHEVHWNNLAKPLEFELKAPSGSITPAKGVAPKVKVEADLDPREFVVEVKDLKRSEPLELVVRYFACSDTEGWCKAVTQTYLISLETDTDAGRVSAPRGGGGRGGQRGGGGGRRPGGGDPAGMLKRLQESDDNGDGKITSEEFSGPDRLFERVDANSDGVLTKEEITAMEGRFRTRGGRR